MNIRFIIGLAVAATTGGLLGSALRAQGQSAAAAGVTVTSGVYTAGQAKRGQAIYVDSCAKCHIEDLSGGKDSPPLVGDDFLGGWKGKSVGDLFDEVRMTMPFDNPGKLTAEQYSDVIAYIFSANKFPAGDKELDHDTAPLQKIQIVKPS
jgi:S-disulfanyl-L-cysteine oxidoreductase SoxD